MKTFVSFVVVSILSVVIMQSALAESSKKMVRNDRVQVTKHVAHYDINPFVDSRRVIRNDRVQYNVQYNMPKVKKVTEKKQRIMRNDRVSVIKAI